MLNHPNIVGVYDSGQAGGYYYFVMEYLDGVKPSPGDAGRAWLKCDARPNAL